MNPIETTYKGYRFRSRLEARWGSTVGYTDVVSNTEYNRVHRVARKQLAGMSCLRCGAEERIDAALNPWVSKSNVRQTSTGLAYSISADDYSPLCHSCHFRMDLVEGRTHCKRGHEYTEENTRVKPDGSRKCRQCHREDRAKAMSDPEKREAVRARERQTRPPLSATQHARKMELQRQRRAGREES